MVRRRQTARHGGPNLLPVFFLLILIAVAVVFLFLYPSIRDSKFGKSSRFNVVINQDPPIVVSADIKTKKAAVLIFPQNMQLMSAHGYGQLPAGSLYKAGQWDKRGTVVLADTLSDALGAPIDLVTEPITANFEAKDFSSRMAFWQKGMIKIPQITLKSFLTPKTLNDYSFNIYDFVKFALFWGSVRSDRIDIIDLKLNSVDMVQGDGSQVKTLDIEGFDQSLFGELAQDDIIAEGYRVGVINATVTNGLGARAARFLINQGINVVLIDTQNSGLSECEVSYSDSKVKPSKTLSVVVQYFDCKVTENKDLDSRYDILIVLGNQFAQRFIK